jgi:hypothetical protein
MEFLQTCNDILTALRVPIIIRKLTKRRRVAKPFDSLVRKHSYFTQFAQCLNFRVKSDYFPGTYRCFRGKNSLATIAQAHMYTLLQYKMS